MRTLSKWIVLVAVGLAAVQSMRAQSTRGEYVYPSFNHCINQFYDAQMHGWLAFRNDCSEPLDVVYMARRPPYGASTMTLKSGRHDSTGYSRSEVAEKGLLHLYVCPENYIPVDANDRYVKRPDEKFRCKRN